MLNSAFAINTYSYIWRYSARECLAHLADQGYTQFEIMVNPPHLWPATLEATEREAMSRLLAERKLRVLSLNPPSLDLNLVSPAEEMRRYTIQHYLDVIRLAGEWGAAWVVVVPGKTHPLLPAPWEQVQDWFKGALDELLAEAERQHLELLLENVPAAFLPKAADLADFVEAFGHPRLGLVYDVANAVFAGEDPHEGILTARKHMRLVHLSDTGTKKWDHGPVGIGVVPFQSAAEALAEVGYANPSVLEIISHDPGRDIPESARKLKAMGWSGE